MQLGIDVLRKNGFRELKGLRIGLCTNYQATDKYLRPTIELFKDRIKSRLSVIFAPEHGLYSALQDQTSDHDALMGKVPVISLYGRKLSPSGRDMAGIDALVIDLIDIGTRCYTFAQTATLCMKIAARSRKPVYVLDRPNPLDGKTVEGPVLEPGFSSFVGLYPVPVRHGMTIAEICRLVNDEYHIGCDLRIIRIKGWNRAWSYIDTGLPWTMPSPNMPSAETAHVYPGMCLLEGTNVSEGRGTTRPFEIFGAPWIDPAHLVGELNKTMEREGLAGVRFRPVFFKPTFNKFANEICGGAFIHVTDQRRFRPFLTGLAVINVLFKHYPRPFAWRKPPYEYEKKKLPFDILAGNSWIRKSIERGEPLRAIERKWQKNVPDFLALRQRYLLYK
jgi:uncharacterized protein YbbC (DUF1343 family)